MVMLQLSADDTPGASTKNDVWLRVDDKLRSGEPFIQMDITFSNKRVAQCILKPQEEVTDRATLYTITWKNTEVVDPTNGEILFDGYTRFPSGQVHCDFYANRLAQIDIGGRLIYNCMGYFVPTTGAFTEISDDYSVYTGNANSTPNAYYE